MTDAEDLELLQRHEPLLRFTLWRAVLPDVGGGYVEHCDLLEGPTLREASVAIPDGSLDLERLAAAGDPPPGQAQFLRFVPTPSTSIELARWRNRPGPPALLGAGPAGPGRPRGPPRRRRPRALAAPRGRVPGGTAAAAAVRYDAIRARTRGSSITAGSIREGRWVVLHYMFLYAMNDWRSTFEGANDHEADWEQCFVVLEELDDGEMQPAWFCAAAHDEKGDDLRRRWDDPRLQVIDGHPVVYPGAGSHATYLEHGEYIMRLPFPGERNIRGPLDLLRRIWRDTLDQPDPGDLAENARRAFSVPFVDYARGDGIAIGPGGDIGWTPIVISDDDGWVDRYHGLWGLDTGDRFAGERAPAGPKYTRIGTVRQSWHDPLGFAGLDKVAPPSQAIPALEARIAELHADASRPTPRRSRGARGQPAAAGRRGRRRPGGARRRRLPGGPGGRAARGRGEARRPADPRRRARHGDRGRRAPARAAARRPRWTTRGPTSTTRPSRSPRRDPASPAGRGVGGAQRRPPGRRPRGDRLVPDPAAGRGDPRPLRLLSRDRVVLPQGRPRAGPAHLARARAHHVAILAVTFLRELLLVGLPASASCSSSTTSGSSAAGTTR